MYRLNFKRKNIVKLFLTAAAVLFFNTAVSAESFYIKDFNADIKVNKNKQASITETISVYFTDKSHGLIRKIPYEKASVTGIIIENDKYSISKTGGGVSIKIGGADKYIEGSKKYVIKYDYNYHDNKNEFYHNIIGTEWNVPINHVKFKITLPGKINPDKAGLSTGRYGAAGFNGGAVYTVNGNIITGETQRTLQPNEGITFRVSVPKGYFNNYYDWAGTAAILLIIILTVISYFTWLKIGREDIIIPVVNFEIPKGVKNVFEADIYYNGKPSRTGLIALIIEAADKGRLKIENTKDDFTLYKLKSTDDLEGIEKQLLDAVFKEKDIVTKRDLYNSPEFYKTCSNILSKRYTAIYNKESIDPAKTRFMHRCTILILLFLSAFSSSFDAAPFLNFKFITCWGVPVLAALFFVKKDWLNEDKAWAAPWGITGLMFMQLAALGYVSSEYIPQIVFAAVCGIITTVCAANLPKINKKAVQIKGQLLGLKKYIETAEKHQIEQTAEENPGQFYNILPYAYILGVTSVWLDKFNAVLETHPEMFKPDYNTLYFAALTGAMLNASMPSYANGGLSSSSDNISSSSNFQNYNSSSGGGGFSGGGGGGGGGSSW